MTRAILLLSTLVASTLSEPPVPLGGGYPGGSGGGYPGGSSGGYPGGSGGGYSGGSGGGYPGGSSGGYPGTSAFGFGNGQFSDREKPMFTHEQDFQKTSGTIWGKWFVALPDGRIQRVEYDADESGFHPIITYDEPVGNGLGGGNGEAGGYSNGGSSRGNGGGYSGGNGGGYSGGASGGRGYNY